MKICKMQDPSIKNSKSEGEKFASAVTIILFVFWNLLDNIWSPPHGEEFPVAEIKCFQRWGKNYLEDWRKLIFLTFKLSFQSLIIRFGSGSDFSKILLISGFFGFPKYFWISFDFWLWQFWVFLYCTQSCCLPNFLIFLFHLWNLEEEGKLFFYASWLSIY